MASTTTSETENRILDRVRALLAKAESTTFAEEAAALTAKAHELMATHAIDMAMIQQQEGQGEVIAIQMFIPGPYVKEKFLLLAGVARGNRCRTIFGLDRKTLDALVREQKLDELMDDGEHATIVGYRSDLDVVELLFTSLLLQAVNVMLARGVVVSPHGQNRTKSFRRSFLIAFAYTIGDRLRDTESRVTAEADRAAGGGVLPVLASRVDHVDKQVDKMFPNTTSLRTSISNGDGVTAGRAAGLTADVGSSRIGKKQSALR